eukprot:SAG11_NODE_563_length_8516_cov_11.669122_8_plen_61_part_00
MAIEYGGVLALARAGVGRDRMAGGSTGAVAAPAVGKRVVHRGRGQRCSGASRLVNEMQVS